MENTLHLVPLTRREEIWSCVNRLKSMSNGEVFYGESTTTEDGVNYQVLAVMTGRYSSP